MQQSQTHIPNEHKYTCMECLFFNNSSVNKKLINCMRNDGTCLNLIAFLYI